ncbi:unnamed protein product [Mytilus edulis]|uniref:FLYWCH-type domain-containing protein n=1 Tax=Mytilus edulis TaxID=6550 RepID=A0A8S3TAJ9_MYTED|nr:unnamed protein product [Mytilus edulis]
MVRPRCNVCKKAVTIRQDALQCDTCDNWQHRLCETVDTLPDQLTDAIDQPTYSVVDGASQRGKRKLVDVDGYTYTVKKQKGDSTTCWCSVRNKTTSCSATVLQKGDNFTAGRKSHCHTANPGTVTVVKITAQGKSQARQDVFRSAGDIVETAILQHSDPSQPAVIFSTSHRLCLDMSSFLPAYRQQDCLFKYVRKLMALPFLPADHIRPAFRRLKDLQTDPLQRLVKYVEEIIRREEALLLTASKTERRS